MPKMINNIDIDKKIDIELKDNERYQELLRGINSLNKQIVQLEWLKTESDTERKNIEKQVSYYCKWG